VALTLMQIDVTNINTCKSKLDKVWVNEEVKFNWKSDLIGSRSYSEVYDVTSVFKKHGVRHHLYTDEKQGYVDVPVSNIATARTTLQDCVSDVSSWCSSRRLQLNSGKTELIGMRQSLQKANGDK